ncbi:MAG: hypothetical protein Q8P57_03465 [Candidatus Pacearchaeota archaeon]|nr:hypothetical protein [Candidatus Pacearchaeota archaeon]
MRLLPQEIEVKYIIPAIRRDFAMILSEKHKISYGRIGLILGITKPAVSQYLNKKRVTKIKLHSRIVHEIEKSCKKLLGGKTDSVKEIGDILRFIRKKKLHCEVCGKMIDGVLHDCKQIIAKYEDD